MFFTKSIWLKLLNKVTKENTAHGVKNRKHKKVYKTQGLKQNNRRHKNVMITDIKGLNISLDEPNTTIQPFYKR